MLLPYVLLISQLIFLALPTATAEQGKILTNESAKKILLEKQRSLTKKVELQNKGAVEKAGSLSGTKGTRNVNASAVPTRPQGSEGKSKTANVLNDATAKTSSVKQQDSKQPVGKSPAAKTDKKSDVGTKKPSGSDTPSSQLPIKARESKDKKIISAHTDVKRATQQGKSPAVGKDNLAQAPSETGLPKKPSRASESKSRASGKRSTAPTEGRATARTTGKDQTDKPRATQGRVKRSGARMINDMIASPSEARSAQPFSRVRLQHQRQALIKQQLDKGNPSYTQESVVKARSSASNISYSWHICLAAIAATLLSL